MPLESMTQPTQVENDVSPVLSGGRRLEWAKKSFLTLCDQGFVSGTNFILGVILAKRQGPTEYGAYSLSYAVFILLANIHQALLLDPMSVLEAELFPGNRPAYVRAVIKLHAVASALAVALMALVLGILYLTGNSLFTGSVAGMIIAFPCVLLYWVVRCGVYLDFTPGRAAIAGCLYSAVCLAGLFLVVRLGLLTPFSQFALMALGSAAAAVYLLRDRLHDIIFGASRGTAEVWRAHWQYGRWSLAGVGVTWLQANSLSVATGWLLGVRNVGILAALVNFILPVNHVGMASLRLFMPRLAGLRARRGARALSQVVRQLSISFAGAASVYWVVIWAFHGPLIQKLYGGRFDSIAPLLPWATAYIVIWSAMFPFQMGLRALLAFDSDFLVLCVLAGIILPVGIPAMMFAGLKGVFAATFLAHALGLATVIILFQRRVHQRQTS